MNGTPFVLTSSCAITSSFNTVPIRTKNMGAVGIQATFIAPVTGTFKLQTSFDAFQTNGQAVTTNGTGIVNWTDVTGSNVTTSGSVIFDVYGTSAPWFRGTWTNTGTGGAITGSVTMTAFSKQW